MKDPLLYLEDILERIDLIQEFTRNGRENFYQSRVTQEAVMRCFEVIGEAVKRIDNELLMTQPHIPWDEVAGFRDFLIHNYDRIILDIV